MTEALFWLYMANAVLLINHEIDSAFREEWKLFGLPGGITGFLALHIPLVALILYGLVEVSRGTLAGSVFSLALSCAGIAAFVIHMAFLGRGRNEFGTRVSLSILVGTLLSSVVQMILSLSALLG